jgi:galactokinase
MKRMANNLAHEVIEGFKNRFGKEPGFVVRAPGRVNLIGEHTDYNDGYVMPMAIDRATWIALSPRADGKVRLHSVDYQETASFDLADLRKEKMSWAEYPKGVASVLQNEGYALSGWDGATVCDVPMGAGLSSSASFELAVARAFAAVSGFEWDAPKMARLCQKAENQWVGVNCGIMDQMISAVGKAGHAVLIDCRDLSMQAVPLPEGTSVVVMDTATRRGLVESAYNDRRAQCEAAAAFFGVPALREVPMNTYVAKAKEAASAKWRRARHVISEIQRTVEAAEAMKKGDATRLGRLMNESHDSLRDDFEVTNKQLEVMVEIARKTGGCIGARMTGAGFGGCAVALVQSGAAQSFIEQVGTLYEKETGLTPKIYLCEATNGAELVK